MEVISIIGAKGGLGKTFIAVNLANYLSLCQLRVLLIDCDFNTNGATNFMELNELSIDDYSKFKSFESILGVPTDNGYLEEIEKPEIPIHKGFSFLPTTLNFGYTNYKNFKLEDLEKYEDSIGYLFEKWNKTYDVIIMDHAGGYTDLAYFLLSFSSKILLVNADNASGIKSARKLFEKMSIFNREIVQCVNVLDAVPSRESESLIRKCYGFLEKKECKEALAKGVFLNLDQSNTMVLEKVSLELLPKFSERIAKSRNKILDHHKIRIRQKQKPKWERYILRLHLILMIIIPLIGYALIRVKFASFKLNVPNILILLLCSWISIPLLCSFIMLIIAIFHPDKDLIIEVLKEYFNLIKRILTFWTRLFQTKHLKRFD